MKNNKTSFFFVSYSDRTWVFDQSEHTQGPISIIKTDNILMNGPRSMELSSSCHSYIGRAELSYFFVMDSL